MAVIERLGWFDLLLLALACWRISHLISKDFGPWNVLDKLRKAVPLGGLTGCMYCLSVWFSGVLLLVHVYVTTWPTWILAVAGCALMLRAYTGAGSDHER